MTTVKAFRAVDMTDGSTYYGEVVEASSSRIIVQAGSLATYYYGSFWYGYYGDVYGTLSGAEGRVNGEIALSVKGFAVDAYDAANDINSGDATSLYETILSGRDRILGSGQGDYLTGWDGDDAIYGGAGNDHIWGGSQYLWDGDGSDRIDGGAGYDTAYFSGGSNEYEVVRYGNQAAVVGTTSWDRGADFLTDVEALNFSDGQRGLPHDQFDPLAYIASYGGLIQAFGDDAQKGFQHYAKSGMMAGREVSFDGLEYIASYDDLTSHFGLKEKAATIHFINGGYYAGREVSFDGLEYIASYSDLIQHFGTNEEAATKHYIRGGRAAGRDVTFDALEYIASHDDLLTAFGSDAEAGALHYIKAGHRVGRIANNFDAEQYLANYSDLRSSFGTDAEAATKHYIGLGFWEGRTDEMLVSDDGSWIA